MPDTTWHDRDQAWSNNLRPAVDGDFEFTLDHFNSARTSCSESENTVRTSRVGIP
jgi:hypothetical protein